MIAEQSLPVVTAIMPTHEERAPFFVQAIEQLCRQTYPNIQLVILDDSSTQKAWAKSHLQRRAKSWITYVYLDKPVTVGKKRNLGVKVAKGSIIVHWDDDDFYLKSRVQDLVQPILSQTADMVIPRSEVWYVAPEDRFVNGKKAGFLMGHMAFNKRQIFETFGCSYPDESVDEDTFLATCSAYAGATILPLGSKAIVVRHKNTWKVSTHNWPGVSGEGLKALLSGSATLGRVDFAEALSWAKRIGKISKRTIQREVQPSERRYYYDIVGDDLGINYNLYYGASMFPDFKNSMKHRFLLEGKYLINQLQEHDAQMLEELQLLKCECKPIDLELPCPCKNVRKWRLLYLRQGRLLQGMGGAAENNDTNTSNSTTTLPPADVSTTTTTVPRASAENLPWSLWDYPWYYYAGVGIVIATVLILVVQLIMRKLRKRSKIVVEDDTVVLFDDEKIFTAVPNVLKEPEWSPPKAKVCPSCQQVMTLFNQKTSICANCVKHGPPTDDKGATKTESEPARHVFAGREDIIRGRVVTNLKHKMHSESLEQLRREYVKKRMKNVVLDTTLGKLHEADEALKAEKARKDREEQLRIMETEKRAAEMDSENKKLL